MSVKLLSINCRGLNDKEKRKEVFHWINNHPRGDFDIIFLQETHSTFKSENKFETQWRHNSNKYCTFFSHCSSSSKGVMTIIDQKYKLHITSVEVDARGRYIILDLTIGSKIYHIINIYSPNLENENEQVDFWNEITTKLRAKDLGSIIMGGDLNTFLDCKLDKSPSTNKKYKGVDKLKNTIKEFNLIDIWRIKNPGILRFTWRRNKPKLIQSRLDYWLLSAALNYDYQTSDIIPGFRTDHSAIFFKN